MLFGRDAERALIGALLDAARDSRSGALALRGEAGVGKTVLLEDARARASDMHVLCARGVESESELPFAALQQLLRPALRHLDRLPAPQAAALRSALGLADGGGQERFLIYSGCLSLLSELAEERPVLCLVDDAHWLDAGSADALQFVARRLDAEGVVLLFGAREGDVRVFDAPDVPSHTVDGLDDGGRRRTARPRRRAAAPRVRERLLEQTHGNALALVELPAALSAAQLAGDEPLPEALPMTAGSSASSTTAWRACRRPTRLALLAAAADDSESAAVVERAVATLSSGGFALDAAEEAGLLTIAGGRVAFRHPLVRSAVYGAATSTERRAVHGALAAALEGDDEQADRRAWHLAASALEPDEGVVHALEEAAERAVERGGHAAAAKALERAATLTADRAARARRLARAASLSSLIGRDAQALALAERAERAHGRPGAAGAVRVRARRRGAAPGPAPGRDPDADRGGLRRGPHDAGRAAELLMQAASAAWQSADVSAVREIARIANAVIPADGDETSQFFRGVILGFAAMMCGDHAEAARCLEPAIAHGALTDRTRHAFLANLAALWLGDDEAASALVGRAIRLARASGEVGELVIGLSGRSAQLIIAQRNDEAEVVVHEAAALARELSAENILLLLHAVLAIIAADPGPARGVPSLRRGGDRGGTRQRAAQPRVARHLRARDRRHQPRPLGGGARALRHDGRAGRRATADPVMAALMLPDKIEAAVRAGRPGARARGAAPVRGVGDALRRALGGAAAGGLPRAARRGRRGDRALRGDAGARRRRAPARPRADAHALRRAPPPRAAPHRRADAVPRRARDVRGLPLGAARRARAGRAARDRRDGPQARPEHDRPAHPAGAADRALRRRAGCRTRRSRPSCSCRRARSTRTCARCSRSSASRRAPSSRGSRSASRTALAEPALA